MKSLLISIDAKYIHMNLALRYLKANTTYDTTILEFTIKDDISFIVEPILERNPDIVAFSVYIWNVEMVKAISSLLKETSNCILIWGGPEVSYESSKYVFHREVDYIIQGEGEISFHQLLDSLHNKTPMRFISGLVYLDQYNELCVNPIVEIEKLDDLKSPYHFNEDIPHIPNKIQYVETSRGCPFKCSYCLASLEKGVRYFDIEHVKSELGYLMAHGAKTFKFLDRTFNIFPKYAISIFEYIFENYKEGMSFQFEITGDILKTEIIDFLNERAPKNLIRFEIGIQSTNPLTNLAVKRKQNNKVLFQNIEKILKCDKVDLHLDLIAGLPLETLELFKNTFNEVFLLYAKELQLGFLKMLKGTLLRKEASKYHYSYDELAPYEILENEYLSTVDIALIHKVEETLEIFWNKGFMNNAIKFITSKVNSPFDFFYGISLYLEKIGFNYHRYQLYEVYQNINSYIEITFPGLYPTFFSIIKKDYLLYHKIKPQMWWGKHELPKNELFRKIFSEDQSIPIDTLYKYGVITDYLDDYFVILYLPNETISYIYKKKKLK